MLVFFTLAQKVASYPTDTRAWGAPPATATWPTPTDAWFAEGPDGLPTSAIIGIVIAAFFAAGFLILAIYVIAKPSARLDKKDDEYFTASSH
jgi:hypothetical protein